MSIRSKQLAKTYLPDDFFGKDNTDNVRKEILDVCRDLFAEGYDKGQDETIERAIAWLEENSDKYIINCTDSYPDAPFKATVVGNCWAELREAMGMEPKNYRVRFVDMQVGFDPAITWQDVKKIVEIADKLCPYAPRDLAELGMEFQTEQAYYQEVLNRFLGNHQ